jgi:hypothetical protein
MKRLTVFFFLFIFIQGFLYLFIIPPWQSPDETHHFGYGMLLSTKAGLRSEEHKKISQNIMESMDDFHSWEYMNFVQPDPFPVWLEGLSFYKGISSLYEERAPLYYLTISFILKKLENKKILNQFYWIRCFSFFLFLLTVYFTYLTTKLVFKGHLCYILAVVCFSGLLPQFIIISTSVNPINFIVFLFSVFLYVILYSLYKGKYLWAVLLGPLIILVGLFTHRAYVFMIPPFLVYLLILFIQSFKEKKRLLKYSVILILLMVLIAGLYLTFSFILPDSFVERIDRESGIKQLESQWSRFVHYFRGDISEDVSRSLYWFMDGFFKSFWFFAGWLRFGYIVDIYSVLMLTCIFSVLGIFKYLYSYFRKRVVSFDFQVFLVLIALVVPIISGTLIHCFPRHYAAQGRYLFPAIGAIGILFVFGLKEIIPKKGEQWVPLFVIFGFVVLDVYTLFHPLIRAFYFFRNF